MAPRTRVLAIVGAAAALVVAGTVTVTWLQTRGETTHAAGVVSRARAGRPPLSFDFGVRDDAEVRAIAHAATLYRAGKVRAARAIFDRYHSVDAQIGSAFARWPGSLDAVERIVASHRRSAAARLHLAWALLWAGRNADAAKQFRIVETQFPDAPESVSAENVLYPGMAADLPPLVLGLGLPSAPTAADQLRELTAAAKRPDVDAKLRYGLALWTLDRRVSAERAFAEAARLAPQNAVAQTAAAVGLFTKRDPVRAFARLGPLSGRFPGAAVVHLHLGTLLIWTGSVRKAPAELRLAARAAPGSAFATAARQLLAVLEKDGTK
jgi:tetratricopeptide (TPR) repeat protein